jgi:tRNA-Thr(GGU) m(6)t(6)A37 methyltransferase TsaA
VTSPSAKAEGFRSPRTLSLTTASRSHCSFGTRPRSFTPPYAQGTVGFHEMDSTQVSCVGQTFSVSVPFRELRRSEIHLQAFAGSPLSQGFIEGFSHLYVIWVFDRAGGYELLGTPPTDSRPHGVFATRSPKRPNPIGLTVVRLLGREGPRLRVAGVDMLDRTPILDIKPYLSSVATEELRRGWLAEVEERN